MNEILNVRLEAESLTYQESPLKQKNDNGSTIKYNSINIGPSQNILLNVNNVQMWLNSKALNNRLCHKN